MGMILEKVESVLGRRALLYFWLMSSTSFAFTPCEQALLSVSPEETVSRLFRSPIFEKYEISVKGNKWVGLLLGYLHINGKLDEFYSMAELPAESWNLDQIAETITKLNTWVPSDSDNPTQIIGTFELTQHAVYYLQMLGIDPKWLASLVKTDSARNGWTQPKPAILKSFFFPDHGPEHIRELLARVDTVHAFFSESQKNRYSFLLEPSEARDLWLQRLRLAVFLHDIVALNHRDGHAFHACGYAHYMVGEIVQPGYRPLNSETPEGFWQECSIVGTIALMHSKSAIRTDDLPRFEEVLLAHKLSTLSSLFFGGGVLNPKEVGYGTVAIPQLDPEERERMILTGEVMRLLDAHRPRGLVSRKNPIGLVNTAGYPFKIVNDRVVLTLTKLPFGKLDLPVPQSEETHLYGQLVLDTPTYSENKGPTLSFGLVKGGKTRARQIQGWMRTEPFKKILSSGIRQPGDLLPLTPDTKAQSILNVILDVAFEYRREIRDRLQIEVRPLD